MQEEIHDPSLRTVRLWGSAISKSITARGRDRGAERSRTRQLGPVSIQGLLQRPKRVLEFVVHLGRRPFSGIRVAERHHLLCVRKQFPVGELGERCCLSLERIEARCRSSHSGSLSGPVPRRDRWRCTQRKAWSPPAFGSPRGHPLAARSGLKASPPHAEACHTPRPR